jgi:HK97 family phage major capsid protein
MTTENTEDLIKGVESALDSAIQKYEGQLQESKSAANEVRDEVRQLAEKHSELVEQSEALSAKFQEFEQNAMTSMKGGGEREPTWGQKLVDSESFKAMVEGSKHARVNVKNTIIGEVGSPQDPVDTLTPADRLPGIVPGAFRQLSVLDVVPMGTTNSNAVEYTRESSWTNDAAETAENSAKPESDLTFELVSDPVRTIAHWIKASRQVLDDAPALESYIDRRLRHGLRQRLESQILTGNGTSPNIEGLTATGRHTDFTAASGANRLDSLNRAKYDVIGADFVATHYFVNPADWSEIELLKAGSGNEYAAANGNAVGYIANGLQPLAWGLPVIANNNVSSGEFFCVDINSMMLMMRQGAVVEMFEQDDTNVQSNLVTIRAELRAALAVFQPTAIRYGSFN